MVDVVKVSVAFTDGPLVVSPTWTRIDNLAGCRVREISWQRGRATEFEKTGTGTATVAIADLDGIFDPTNGGSAYFPNVLPDRQAKIELYNPVLAEYQTVFRGFVEDWNYTLDVMRQFLELRVDLVDGFGWLNDHELQPYPKNGDVPFEGSEGNVCYQNTTDSVKTRIDQILDDVAWPDDLRNVFSGNVNVQDTVYAPGTQALAALQDAADAEFPGVANLYIDREGILTFHGRQARFRPDVAEYGIRRQEVGDPSVTDADDTICPISELGFNLGKEALYNSVLALPQKNDGDFTAAQMASQLKEDGPSITAHGKKSLSFTDLLTLEGVATGNDPFEETALMADYYRDNYKDPLPRISRMVFKSKMPTHRLAAPLWRMLTRADISDLLTVTTAHPGGGGFDGDYYVEGIRCTVRPANPTVPLVVLDLDVSPQALFDVNPFDADPDPGT